MMQDDLSLFFKMYGTWKVVVWRYKIFVRFGDCACCVKVHNKKYLDNQATPYNNNNKNRESNYTFHSFEKLLQLSDDGGSHFNFLRTEKNKRKNNQIYPQKNKRYRTRTLLLRVENRILHNPFLRNTQLDILQQVES